MILKQKNEFHQYLDSPKHVTRAKFHASPSLVVPADTCEHNFQKDDKDNKVHTHGRGLVENPGLAPLRSSNESDIQQEKECHVNSGIKQDTYLLSSNMIDVTKSHDVCKDFSKDIADVDITTKTKESKITETHTEQMENPNRNSTYFVLSADENKKVYY